MRHFTEGDEVAAFDLGSLKTGEGSRLALVVGQETP